MTEMTYVDTALDLIAQADYIACDRSNQSATSPSIKWSLAHEHLNAAWEIIDALGKLPQKADDDA